MTGKQFPRTTIIGGLKLNEPIALYSFLGTTDTILFNSWINLCLLPELRKDDVVIMDNARIHKSTKTIKLIESKGAKVLFQPPYSPFLNKIENYWSFIKKEIGLVKKKFNKFDDCLDCVFRMNYGNSSAS